MALLAILVAPLAAAQPLPPPGGEILEEIKSMPQFPPQLVNASWEEQGLRINWTNPEPAADTELESIVLYELTASGPEVLASLSPGATSHVVDADPSEERVFYLTATNSDGEESAPSLPVSTLPYPYCMWLGVTTRPMFLLGPYLYCLYPIEDETIEWVIDQVTP